MTFLARAAKEIKAVGLITLYNAHPKSERFEHLNRRINELIE
jgi:hypothetical protein